VRAVHRRDRPRRDGGRIERRKRQAQPCVGPAGAGDGGGRLPERGPCGVQRGQGIGGIHRPRRQRFRQLAAVRVEHQRQVRVPGRRQPKRPLQQDLPRRGVEQVGAADHVGDALRRIVHHDRQLVGPGAVGAAQDEVADCGGDVLREAPLERVVERDRRAIGHPQADRGIGPHRAGDAFAMHAAAGRQRGAAAAAGERVAGREQGVERRLVGIAAGRLPQHRAVRFQPETGQRAQLAGRGARYLARRVEVFDPDQPFAACMPREQPAPERRQQRTEVQRAGGRGGEAATMAGDVGTVGHCTCI
jgi:hypothetical protein